jgi:hypothetical protein
MKNYQDSAQGFDEEGIRSLTDYYSVNKAYKRIRVLRWAGTVSYLIGMSLTALNIYPLNLIFGALGGLLWFTVGKSWGDRALCTAEGASFLIYASGLILLIFK